MVEGRLPGWGRLVDLQSRLQPLCSSKGAAWWTAARGGGGGVLLLGSPQGPPDPWSGGSQSCYVAWATVLRVEEPLWGSFQSDFPAGLRRWGKPETPGTFSTCGLGQLGKFFVRRRGFSQGPPPPTHPPAPAFQYLPPLHPQPCPSPSLHLSSVLLSYWVGGLVRTLPRQGAHGYPQISGAGREPSYLWRRRESKGGTAGTERGTLSRLV